MSKKDSMQVRVVQFTLILFFSFPYLLYAQQANGHAAPGLGSNEKYSVYGTITAEKTGETVIGASISVLPGGAGTSSNEYGFYSLSLNKGNYTITVSSVGMTAD